MAGKLAIDSGGKVTGPITMAHNDSFPTVNGRYGSGAMMGVVMHTMVGNLPRTTAIFNDPAREVSTHFGIAQDGSAHQFGPIGKGWIAWAQAAGNLRWYSIEHADNGNPENPLTDAQLTSSAQIVELLSRFAGFPLQVTDAIAVPGYGTHVMGGVPWGGHSCPGPGPRAGQRQEIIQRAIAIRGGATTSPLWGLILRVPAIWRLRNTAGFARLFDNKALNMDDPRHGKNCECGRDRRP